MFEFKNDKYRKARGGKAFAIDIFCQNCSKHLLVYQKDGDGQLKRCYLNRILAPDTLEKLQHNRYLKSPDALEKLICPYCLTVIGVPHLHHDGRIAFRLRQGFFFKKRRTQK